MFYLYLLFLCSAVSFSTQLIFLSASPISVQVKWNVSIGVRSPWLILHWVNKCPRWDSYCPQRYWQTSAGYGAPSCCWLLSAGISAPRVCDTRWDSRLKWERWSCSCLMLFPEVAASVAAMIVHTPVFVHLSTARLLPSVTGFFWELWAIKSRFWGTFLCGAAVLAIGSRRKVGAVNCFHLCVYPTCG